LRCTGRADPWAQQCRSCLAATSTTRWPQTVGEASNLVATPTTGIDYLGLVLAKHEAEHFGAIAFRDLAPQRQQPQLEDYVP